MFSIQTIERLCYLGIALVADVGATLNAVATEAEHTYQELVLRGARDNSELAQSLRRNLDQGILTARDISRRVPGLA